MFKKIEYLGFEGQPALKVRAEQLTSVLANEVRTWRDDVEVLWSPVPEGGGLNLTLSLALPSGATGSAQGTFRPKDFAEEWLLRSHCRQVWSDLLGVLSGRLMGRIRESLAEPAGV